MVFINYIRFRQNWSKKCISKTRRADRWGGTEFVGVQSFRVSDLNCKQPQEAWLVEKMGQHQMPLIVLRKYSRELHY